MRYLGFLVFFVFISSCGLKKKASEHNMMAEGTVMMSTKEGECTLWIKGSNSSTEAGFYPVNLDEKFKKNGNKIAFNYNDSRAPLPDGCNNLKAIVISEIIELK